MMRSRIEEVLDSVRNKKWSEFGGIEDQDVPVRVTVDGFCVEFVFRVLGEEYKDKGKVWISQICTVYDEQEDEFLTMSRSDSSRLSVVLEEEIFKRYLG